MDDRDSMAARRPIRVGARSRGEAPATARVAPAVFAVIVLAIVATGFVGVASRGFGFGDESFYLLSARQHDLPIYFSSFGWYLDALFRLCAGKLWLVRTVGATILLGLALALADAFTRFLAARLDLPLGRTERIVVSACAGAAVFVYYHQWVPTPSYNWLALCGTILCAVALLHADRREGKRRAIVIPALVLGLGGAVAFMGKVTTAAALAIVAVAWLVSSARRLRDTAAIGGLAAIVAAAFVLLHIRLFEGGLPMLAARARTTVALEITLGADHTLASRTAEAVHETLHAPGFLFGAAPFTSIAALFLSIGLILRPAARRGARGAAFGVIGIVWLADIMLRGSMRQIADAWPVIALILAALAVLFAGGAGPSILRRDALRLLLLLLALPLAYAFGTNVGIYIHAGTAFVFYALALLLIAFLLRADGGDGRPIAIVIAVVGVYVLAVAGYAYAHPWRQAGLGEQRYRLCLPAAPTCVDVDRATRDYGIALQRGAIGAGWHAGLPLIALTGHTTEPAVLLGGTTPGAPWLYTGFDGAQAYALGVLGRTDRAMLRRAWIVTLPEARGGLSPTLLAQLGLPFPRGYRPVARVAAPQQLQDRILWKPGIR